MSTPANIARWFGIALQSLVLGALLAFAILEMLVVAGADSVFHYQGF